MNYEKEINKYGSMRKAAAALGMTKSQFVHKYRKQNDLCSRCGKKPDTDKKICSQCSDDFAEYIKINAPKESIERTCKKCGKCYNPWRSRQGNSSFCSRSCRSSYCNKGEKNAMYVHGEAKRKYPIEFYKIRDHILNRDNHSCKKCGIKNEELYDVHHIDFNKHNNDEKNLITLCKQCHSKCHGTSANRKKSKKYYTDFMIEYLRS